jgi:hypothetical protein
MERDRFSTIERGAAQSDEKLKSENIDRADFTEIYRDGSFGGESLDEPSFPVSRIFNHDRTRESEDARGGGGGGAVLALAHFVS